MESPAPSCVSMKIDRSMGLPPNLKDVPYPHSTCLHQRGSGPSCVSMKSDWSMGHPWNFKGADVPYPHSSCEFNSSVNGDHVRCFLCVSILRDPVSIPCGHSYCQHCINTFWAQPGPARDYMCPLCETSYPVRPVLSVNVALKSMLHQQAGFRPACDLCSSLTRRAIKACLTCNVSYCENHLRHHYTVPGLQNHTLVQLNEDTTRLWNSGRMEEIKEEPSVDSECGEHQEITCLWRKKMAEAADKDEVFHFQQASPPPVEPDRADGCSAIRDHKMACYDLTNTHTQTKPPGLGRRMTNTH